MRELNIIKRNNISIEGNLRSSKAIIFANGFGTDQSVWNNVKAKFTNEYKIILYDKTGAGTGHPEYYTTERYSTLNGYAEDLLEICAALNLRKTYYAGHSVSGMIGLIASTKDPELFSKLVIIGSSPRYLNAPGYTGGFEPEELTKMYHEIRSNYYNWANGFSKTVTRNEDKPLLREGIAHSILSLRPDIALHAAQAIFESDYRSLLPQIVHDVLILQTARDPAVPEDVGLYLKNHIAKSQLIMIDTEGHFPHLSAHEEVADAIKTFIEH